MQLVVKCIQELVLLLAKLAIHDTIEDVFEKNANNVQNLLKTY